MKYDLLLKGGTLIDPSQNIHSAKDIAFTHGSVTAIGDDLPVSEAEEVTRGGNCIVSRGTTSEFIENNQK